MHLRCAEYAACRTECQWTTEEKYSQLWLANNSYTLQLYSYIVPSRAPTPCRPRRPEVPAQWTASSHWQMVLSWSTVASSYWNTQMYTKGKRPNDWMSARNADCLVEVYTNPPPTWNILTEALENPPVGERLLAQQLRENYCPTTLPDAPLTPQPPTPQPPTPQPPTATPPEHTGR